MSPISRSASPRKQRHPLRRHRKLTRIPRAANGHGSSQHLNLQVGFEKLSGTIDAVMPDKSCFWIWADDGLVDG